MPSQKIKRIGESISYQDSFFIENYVTNRLEKPTFYVHINTSEIKENGEESILEVNGSHEASKIRARLFIDFNHLLSDKANIHSGDTIRLFHKEAKGYMTINERDIDFVIPKYPDFL